MIFESVFQNETSMQMLFLMAGLALVVGIIYTFIVSLRLRTSKGFFVTSCLMPVMVALVIAITGAFLTGSTSTTARIVTIAVALGLIRFRSVNAKSEELLVLFGAIVSGLIFGLGYLVYACILTIAIALVYLVLSYLPIFNGKRFAREKLLKITIPESLDYEDAFKEIFSQSLKQCELVGIKTTGMGSMFKLTYKIVLKDKNKEKQLIDELRVKNGNLEISILPYVDDGKRL